MEFCIGLLVLIHVVDTTSILLLGANMPVHYWGDAILTTCFLNNIIRSSSLENKVPYSILFPKDPLFHISPRVFVYVLLSFSPRMYLSHGVCG